MDVTIRAVREAEYEAVGELTARAYLDDGLLPNGEDDAYLSTLRDVRGRAAHTEVLVAVESDTGALLGTVAFVGEGGRFAELSGPGEGEFRMLAVHPRGRRRGVGEALVRECLTRAQGRGLRRVVLSSTPQMTGAHRLYRRLGFVRAPERDWSPLPGLVLWAFVIDLSHGPAD